MIGLSAPTYDLNGAVLIRHPRFNDSDLATIERRVTRTATLDGGAYVTDNGYSAGDRTLQITIDPDAVATIEAVDYLLRNYATVVVTLPDGVFIGALQRLSRSNGKARLTVLLLAEA